MTKKLYTSFCCILMLEGISYNSFASSKSYYIQMGIYKNETSAIQTLNSTIQKTHLKGKVQKTLVKGKTLYSIQIGPYSNYTTIKEEQSKHDILKKGYIHTYDENEVSHTKKTKSQIKYNKQTKNKTPELIPIDPSLDSFSTTPLSFWGRRPYSSRSLSDGTLGEQTTFFNGDLLVPLIGNNDWIGYVDGAAKYGIDTAWFGSIGTGVRAAHSNMLWGAYTFIDRNASINNADFWVLNPGLEWFTPTMDAHVNAYIPVSSKQKILTTGTGASFGIPDAFFFQGHSLFEYIYNNMDVTGPGADAELGYRFNNFYGLRPFIGGYYFNLDQGSSFGGVEGGIEVPFNDNVTLLVHDAYDRVQKNTAMLTLRFMFDRAPRVPKDNVRTRMLDPFQRHMGAFQTGAGIPIQNVKTLRKNEYLASNNIWFFATGNPAFNAGQGFSNCTYEHPCGTFDQAALDGINSLALNAKLWLNTGTYNNPLVGNALTLYSGQNINGRMNYFKTAAVGTSRPLINDTLVLPGNNDIKNIQVNGNSSLDAGGQIDGIHINAAVGPISISNSHIQAIVQDAGTPVIAFHVIDSNNGISLTNNSFLAVHTVQLAQSISAQGVNINNSQVLFNGNTVNVIAANLANTNSATSTIIGLFTDTPLTVMNSSITVNAAYAGGTSNIYGIRNTSPLLTVQNSAVTVNAAQGNIGTVAVIDGSGTSNVDASTLTLNAAHFQSSNTYNLRDSTVNLTNSFLNTNVTDNNGNNGTVSGTNVFIDHSFVRTNYNDMPLLSLAAVTGTNVTFTNSFVEANVINSSASTTVNGIDANRSITIGNAVVLATAQGSQAVPISGPVTNLGGGVCISVVNGSMSVAPC